MKSVKYLIIGAGISGMSFANEVGDDYLIIEKTNQIGGLCKSIKQGDFVWDCGGHFFHTRNDDIKKNILSSKDILVTKQAKIYIDNRFIDYPFQNNIKELSHKEYTRCLNSFIKKKANKKNNLLGDLYSKFGKGIVNKFLKPYNEKLYCTRLKNLSKTSMGRFFPTFSPDELKKPVQYNSCFYYNNEGIEALLSNIFCKVDLSKVIFDCHYIGIDKSKKILKTNKGDIKYKYLINTSPFDNFYELIDENNHKSDCGNLQYNKVLIFNMGFDKPSKTPYHWIYYPEKRYVFYRVGFYNNVVGGGKLSVYVEVGLKKNQEVNIEKYKKNVLQDMKRAGIIDDGYTLLEQNHMILSPAYIHINEKSDEIVNKRLKEWSNFDVYSIGRYGMWKYSCMEDDILTAVNLAKTLKEKKYDKGCGDSTSI